MKIPLRFGLLIHCYLYFQWKFEDFLGVLVSFHSGSLLEANFLLEEVNLGPFLQFSVQLLKILRVSPPGGLFFLLFLQLFAIPIQGFAPFFVVKVISKQ